MTRFRTVATATLNLGIGVAPARPATALARAAAPPTLAVACVLLVVCLLPAAVMSRAEAGPPWRVCAWGYGSGPSLSAAVAAQGLDEVDVDWYFSRRDGHVGAASNVKQWFVNDAHGAGVAVYATVTNRQDENHSFSGALAHWILGTAFRRTHHAKHLVSLCLQKGYQGIDLDWESLQARDRRRFSLFVEALGHRLHERGLKLAIAVYPKTSEPGPWEPEKAQNWRRLGRAVNEFKVMTYNYHGPWSAPGPIAPPGWMDRVIAFAVTQVAARKVYMGVPFYGFDWPSGRGLHWDDARALIARYHPVQTRTQSGEMTFRYRASGVWHTVFYQDVGALAAKLHIVRKHHPRIGGIAIWVMGGEDPAFWPLIHERMKGE